jgi:hypothetical protein
MINVKAKGARWERELARKFQDALGIEAKRGLSQARGGGKEEPDLVLPLPLQGEAKAEKKPNPREALKQAKNDASTGKIPCAIIKDDRQEPFCVLPLDAFLEALKRAYPSEATGKNDD